MVWRVVIGLEHLHRFFQSVLLLGYGYVHWLHEKVSRSRQPLVHAALLVVSLVTLPVAADASWKGMTLDYPSLAVLAVLAVACGAPYLLLSTTGPLMQAWYARVGIASGDGSRAYRLYALSISPPCWRFSPTRC